MAAIFKGGVEADDTDDNDDAGDDNVINNDDSDDNVDPDDDKAKRRYGLGLALFIHD